MEGRHLPCTCTVQVQSPVQSPELGPHIPSGVISEQSAGEISEPCHM